MLNVRLYNRTIHFTFTFMHLADAFIQSDLHCIQVTVSKFYQLLLSVGIEPMILALLAPCSTSWATGKLYTRTINSSLKRKRFQAVKSCKKKKYFPTSLNNAMSLFTKTAERVRQVCYLLLVNNNHVDVDRTHSNPFHAFHSLTL